MSKVGKFIITFVILGAIATAIAIFFPTLKNLSSGAQLYSAEEVQQAHDDGYAEANTNEKAYKQLIQELNQTVNTLQETVNRLTAEKQALSATSASQTDEIAQKAELIAALQAQITSLQAQITSLQQQIAAYEEIVESLRKANQVRITFVDSDDSLIDVKYVDEGQTVSIEDPADTQYRQFNAWTSNGTAVDLENATFDADTTLKAQYKYFVYLDYHIANGTYATGTQTQQLWVVDGQSIDLTQMLAPVDSVGIRADTNEHFIVDSYISLYIELDDQVFAGYQVYDPPYNSTGVNLANITVNGKPVYIKQQYSYLRKVQYAKATETSRDDNNIYYDLEILSSEYIRLTDSITLASKFDGGEYDYYEYSYTSSGGELEAITPQRLSYKFSIDGTEITIYQHSNAIATSTYTPAYLDTMIIAFESSSGNSDWGSDNGRG